MDKAHGGKKKKKVISKLISKGTRTPNFQRREEYRKNIKKLRKGHKHIDRKRKRNRKQDHEIYKRNKAFNVGEAEAEEGERQENTARFKTKNTRKRED